MLRTLGCFLLGVFTVAALIVTDAPRACAAEKWTFSQPWVRPLSNPYYVIFCDRVKEYTKGEIEIELYIDGLLANHDETFHGVQDGSITIGVISPYVNLIPGGMVNWVPWTISNWEESAIAFDLKDGILHKVMEKAYNDVGMHVLFHVPFGPYGIGNIKRPIRTPADFKDLKLRVSNSLGPVRALENMGKGTGMTLQTIPWTEIYNALSRGVVDGCWSLWPTLVDERIAEVLKYYTDLNFLWDNQNVIINKAIWDRQPQHIKDAVSRAAAEAPRLCAEGTAAALDGYIGKLEADPNIEITFLTPEERAVFEKASDMPAIWKDLCAPWLEKAFPGQNMTQKVQDELARIRQSVIEKQKARK
ncbi:MAG: TRAP transporter substrate-binding protein [Desulfovibrio sp.]|jgi:TRAP-type C4-dicarboxylate transport system substrate-binding protein|nr:TRAP transporter substrate-binding protein [Desulfovibrio sp.]